MTKEKAYEKLNHTLCLNNNNNNIKFAISDIDCQSVDEMVDCLELIKPKQYLKWEDLEFTEEDKEIFVLLNGTKYKLKCYKSGNEDTSIMISLNGVVVADLCSIFYKADKQFFNDLHLERVEEWKKNLYK